MRTPSGDKEAKTVRGSTSVGILTEQKQGELEKSQNFKVSMHFSRESLRSECYRTRGRKQTRGLKEEMSVCCAPTHKLFFVKAVWPNMGTGGFLRERPSGLGS